MKQYAVITGASSGLGKEFAKRLAAFGFRLILIARREERLKKLAAALKTECEIITADLSKEEECYRLYNALKDKNIEIFINNAGFGDCGTFIEGDIEKELSMIRLNVEAVHLLTKLMVKRFAAEDHGYILNVASCAGLFPAGPYMAGYYATKAYVTSMTRAVAEELREAGSHVYIGCLCPGPVNTEFSQVANVQFALKGIRPGYCVGYALDQMLKKRKVVIVPTMLIRFCTTCGRFLPQSLLIRLTAKQQKRKITVKRV